MAVWLLGIIVNLLMAHGYYDIALRDLSLSLGYFLRAVWESIITHSSVFDGKLWRMSLRLRGRYKRFREAFPNWVRMVQDRFWELRLGIHTIGAFYYKNNVFSNDWELGHYEHVPYYVLLAIFARLSLSKEDVFADYGCGKGRATAFASRYSLKKVLGIEISPALAEKAVENAERVRGKKCPVEIIVSDAAAFRCRAATIFYFYNPFGEKTMTAVLQKIKESLAENPRRIQIAYYNPTFENLFSECDWLEKIEEKTYRTWTKMEALKPYIYFYRNTHHLTP